MLRPRDVRLEAGHMGKFIETGFLSALGESNSSRLVKEELCERLGTPEPNLKDGSWESLLFCF